MAWFSENWPAETAWPVGIDRPVVASLAQADHSVEAAHA
jgi:hypothetical protein